MPLTLALCMKEAMALFTEISQVLESAFRKLESRTGPAEFVESGPGRVFRFKEKSLEAAIVQKTARMISTLNASRVLLQAGYVQELGALFRMLDELNEDILFLCQAKRSNELTDLHSRYLAAFYKEEFEKPNNAFMSEQKRETIPRKKIHAYLSRIPEQEMNASDFANLHRTLSQTYSGYVHAASPHIMEMYGGNPPMFHLRGMRGTPRIAEFSENAWDYFYRGLISVMYVVGAFGENELLQELFTFRDYVENASGKTEWEHPEKMVKSEKSK